MNALLWPGLRSKSLAARNLFRRVFLILPIFVFGMFLAGCPNKTPVAQAPPPPPPAPPSPTASIEVTPANVQAGEQVTVSWKTENATEVQIEPIGTVQPNGSQTVLPAESTTYHLVAKGPGGVAEAKGAVTINTAAAEPAPQPEETGLEAEGNSSFDIYFDLNDFSIRADQIERIKNDANFLKQNPDIHITVEGHCDQTGSTEYNLVLGEKRATQVKTALEKGGVNNERIQIVTYGKEKLFCNEETADCWQRNRRAHIRIER